MIASLRSPAAAVALFAGLGFLAAADAPVPKEVAKAATTADIAALQKKLDEIIAEPKKSGPIRTAKGLTLTLIGYGDAATAGQAAKVLAALDKKDYKGAAEAAKGLAAPKADPAALKGIEGKYDLDDVMSPFRLARSGGMDIEKNIRAGAKTGMISGKDAELIGARSAALALFTHKLANDKAKTNPTMTKKWEKFADDMAKAGKELAEEGSKGDKADTKRLIVLFKKLDASCSNCHNDFRD